ncbi:MAG: lysozyme [Burkholderiaceae bacterium]|jgi:lysozyme|nr:lysozyme [Burkholderiaceae bacterium]
MNAALDIAIPLIKRFEGCRLTAYKDVVGVWTIGYGETLNVVPGMVWTAEEADAHLQKRVQQFMSAVLTKCPQLYAEHPNRLAACTSLAYNIGVSAFGASSVCRLTARKEYPQAADAFLLWNKAGGKALRGLTRRREAERALYLS